MEDEIEEAFEESWSAAKAVLGNACGVACGVACEERDLRNWRKIDWSYMEIVVAQLII